MKSAEATPATLPSAKKARREDLEFLPAALEIVETPAPPLAGAIGASLIALFCIALAWAALGHVDIIAVATGKVVPSGRTKVVQPFETGVVRAINVRDGQKVSAGDVLIELDQTMNDAELKHLSADLGAAQLDVARLTAALSDNSDPVASFHASAGIDPELVEVHRKYLVHQLDEQRAKRAALDRQKSQKEAEFVTVTASIEKLEAVLPIMQERVKIREQLYAHETGSKVNYLEILQAYTETKQELAVQRSRAVEAKAAVEAITETRAQTEEEFHRTMFGELVDARRKAAGLRQDVVKATQRSEFQRLTAPVGGTVQQLAVHTVGGVVTPAQALLMIVPDDSHLEVEAMVSNRDVGFVRAGQEAEIKIDTFNFTRYGLIHGRVLNVSRDAIVREKPQDKTGNGPSGGETDSSEPKGQELIYAARVSLDSTEMNVEENTVNLSPGMAVTVEVKTGSRSVISYLLSPLLRYKQESLRER